MNRDARRRDRVLKKRGNLHYLLHRRTDFLRRHIKPGDRVLEVGAGLGIVGAYVDSIRLVSTDLETASWIDVAADVARLPFRDFTFDAVVCLHVLHHVEQPRRAIEEMGRVLAVGGALLIAEPHASAMLRLALRITGHEYVDDRVDPLGDGSCQTRGSGRLGGNNAVGDLTFGDLERLGRAFPYLKVEHHRMLECLTFLNSGGVAYRAPYIPLPVPALELLGRMDDWLAGFPRLFPTSREIVLRKEALSTGSISLKPAH